MKPNETTLLAYGYLSALTATFLWSVNFVIARGLIESIPPINLALFRWVIATCILFPFAIKPLIKDWDIIKNNIVYICITSILGVTLFNTLIYIASHTTTAINLSLIAITFPVFIILISRIVFKELVTVNKALGILLVILGVLTLISKGDVSVIKNISFATGDIWMLLAAITFAIYSILVKQKPKQLSARSFQLSTFLIGLLFLTPFYYWETASTGFDIKSINVNTFYSILYVAIFASLISYILWAKSIDVLGPTKSSMIYYSLPIFSGISAYIFLGEEIKSIHILSMLLIIIGILTALYEKKASR